VSAVVEFDFEADGDPRALDFEQPERDLVRGLRLLYAMAGDTGSARCIVVDGDPQSKARPRFGQGRTYTSKAAREAEKQMARHLREMCPESFTGNVAVACVFFRPNRQRIDVDNMLKHICDSGNGVLWRDDSQVTAIVGIAEFDANHSRTVIAISEHDSTLARGTDDYALCEHCSKVVYNADRPNRNRKYCSSDCGYKARGHDLSEPVPCAHCAKPFRRITNAQKMCSPECRADALRGRMKGRSIDRPFSCCKTCGKQLSHRRGGQCRDCWRANPHPVITVPEHTTQERIV
jgi:Holliday junction resolvase RusA-like endonuclease